MKHWSETRDVLDAIAAARREGQGTALATVIRVRGSVYRREGAKMLVRGDGSTVGNVSGGCLEQDVREVALGVITSQRAERRTYCSGADLIQAWDLGVGCDGEVELLIEPVATDRGDERLQLGQRVPFAVCRVVTPKSAPEQRMLVTRDRTSGSLGSAPLDEAARFRAVESIASGNSGLHDVTGTPVFIECFLPPPQLLIIGAGDDARPLAAFASATGFDVVVVDKRPAYLTAERFPGVYARIESRPEDFSARVVADESCYAVTMTHNFADDRDYLRALLRTSAPYIGMLGPRQRTDRILDLLAGEGLVDAAQRGRIYGPVGLDIGTDGGEQVALSILSEILAVRAGRPPQPLRTRAAPIHDTRD